MITMPMMMAGSRAKEEVWEIIVNTEATTPGAKTTGIPISLYNQPGVTVSVDWGDGTESVLTQASYTEKDFTPSAHEYAQPGVYTVRMKSAQWGDVYIDAITAPSGDLLSHLGNFRNTVIGVGILPMVAGINRLNSSTGRGTIYQGQLEGCFYGCANSITIPEGLFANNPAVASFGSCFGNCSGLTSIPEGLFANNPAVTDFSWCFYGCPSLTSIPEGLFANNPAVTDFSWCFYGCPSLTSIPEGLFANNPAVTTFFVCFLGCSSLTSIPEGLFANNTAVTDFLNCFEGCAGLNNFTLRIGSPSVSSAGSFVTQKAGTTRIIYVPAGSITETTFNSVAADLGLTIIGE